MRSILAALTLLAVLAAPAAAQTDAQAPRKDIQLAAYGVGVTTCNITVSLGRIYPHLFFPPYDFRGETKCSAAVRQTGVASSSGSSGNFCSTFGTTCRSSGETMGGWDVTYEVTLVAPPGQGWVAVPDDCSGAGTDNLRCRFFVQWV